MSHFFDLHEVEISGDHNWDTDPIVDFAGVCSFLENAGWVTSDSIQTCSGFMDFYKPNEYNCTQIRVFLYRIVTAADAGDNRLNGAIWLIWHPNHEFHKTSAYGFQYTSLREALRENHVRPEKRYD